MLWLQALWRSGCYTKIAQMPVILIPVEFDVDTVDANYASRKHSVVLRPFITNDFMTGVAALPTKHLPEDVSSDDIWLKVISSFAYQLLKTAPRLCN